ncbi:MAG: M48 family metallopeptidase [Chloroflexi bacterium]|nr:M48 family metallopeptidase [Chloroflexota bacterium]MQC47732.1 zinc metalloprotease HtpX [Chloroflexota bacterium]
MANTTTFFAQQRANRLKSLLLLMSAGVLLGILGFSIGFGTTGDPFGGLGFTVVAVTIAFALGASSYFAGDRIVLAASQAKPVTEESHPMLMNVVREMTIAANVPMPNVYVIPDSALNAFATGRDPEHASIAVTEGLLDRLDREELQGVLAHELAHVRNLDIRFMLLIGVLVGGVALIADMFLRYVFWFGRGHRGGSGRGGVGAIQIVMMVIAVILAILAPIAARLVQLSVSRQREYLADATSVELTRNPTALENALWKLGTDREVLEVANRATQHLYVVNPIRKFEERASGLWATHPPLADRIDRLRELHSSPPLTVEQRHTLAGH